MSSHPELDNIDDETDSYISLEKIRFMVLHDHGAPALTLIQSSVQSRLDENGFSEPHEVQSKVIIPQSWLPSVIQGLINGLQCLEGE